MYLLYIFPPELHTHTYDFVVRTSLTYPRKILLIFLQIGKAVSNLKYLKNMSV
jgi:hypothetical protein